MRRMRARFLILSMLVLVLACERDTPGASSPEEPTTPPQPTETPPAQPETEPEPEPETTSSAPPVSSQAPTAEPTASAPPVSSQAPTAECKKDTDCACGTNRATGRCAYGPASQIDVKKQCPDFCSG